MPYNLFRYEIYYWIDLIFPSDDPISHEIKSDSSNYLGKGFNRC